MFREWTRYSLFFQTIHLGEMTLCRPSVTSARQTEVSHRRVCMLELYTKHTPNSQALIQQLKGIYPQADHFAAASALDSTGHTNQSLVKPSLLKAVFFA